MMKCNNTMNIPQSVSNWRYDNITYGFLPLTYQSVVSAVTRVFAWICG